MMTKSNVKLLTFLKKIKQMLPIFLFGAILCFSTACSTDSSSSDGENAGENAVQNADNGSSATISGTDVSANSNTGAASSTYSIDANGNLVDASGNIIKSASELALDASGNITDAAGNILAKAGSFTGAVSALPKLDGSVVSNMADAAAVTTDDMVEYSVNEAGDLVDDAGKVVLKAGEFDTDEEGYFVDKKGNRIGRMLKKVGKAIAKAAGATADAFKNTFSGLFKKKASGEAAVHSLSDMKFEDNSAKITGFNKSEFEGLAAALKANPEAKIEVQAFTSDGGNNIKNKAISKARAEWVTKMLTTLGVDKGQIKSKGMSAKDDAKAAANAIEIIVE